MKQCSKCKEWKDRDKFTKDKNKKGGMHNLCKSCQKEYRENNKEKELKRNKEWRENNREHMKEYCKKYYENNKEYYEEQRKEYKRWYENSPMSFNSTSKYKQELEQHNYEEISKSVNGNIMCKCAYCGEWFEPTKLQIKHRINAINGSVEGESRLYCSQNCKNNCPIYYQSLYAKDQKPTTAREVQPELRKMVFARDGHTCQKCNIHKSQLEVGIQCHHIEGIQWEPLQSADMDMCITFCEDCHKEVHQIPGCGYNDLKCAEQNFNVMRF